MQLSSIDIKTAYLNGYIEEDIDIYMTPPRAFKFANEDIEQVRQKPIAVELQGGFGFLNNLEPEGRLENFERTDCNDGKLTMRVDSGAFVTVVPKNTKQLSQNIRA